MPTTFPSSVPSFTTHPATFAVGSMVRIQHNTSKFSIVCPAAWEDDDRSLPTHYNVKASNGRLHIMVPAERLSNCWINQGKVLFRGRVADHSDGNTVPCVKHTRCWDCKTSLSHLASKVCPRCRGLLCECGGCRCNWPFASLATNPGNFHPRYLSR